jgi:rhombotail lipoprotein
MKRLLGACAVTLAVALSGCTLMHSQARQSSSLVSFLYPAGGPPPPSSNAIPELRVPMRVGLAMLPATTGAAPVDAPQKAELLERIRQRFASRHFVNEIVVIPDYYLTNARGYAGLAGLQRLYDVDVIALISYDQVSHREDGGLALGYLTIVGAYIVPGTTHETATLVDLAVVDPATRSLVLRAGGTDTRDGRATLVNVRREVRQEGAAGFAAAADEMIENFDTALTSFESDVRAGSANVRVVARAGRGGGGAAGATEVLALLALGAAGALRRRGALPGG